MSSGPAVSNTTPLINLAGISLLDLLPQLYGQITVPRSVVTEYQAKRTPTDPDLQQLSWLAIVETVPLDPGLPRLDADEAAAISLAKSLSARIILLNERKARRIAQEQGLTVVGTLAVLLRAKNQGLITALKPYLAAMEAQGRYFSESLITLVLKAAGE